MPVINTTVGGTKDYFVEAFNDSNSFEKGETVCLNREDSILESIIVSTPPAAAPNDVFDTMYNINYPHNATEFLTNNGVFRINETGDFIWIADIEPNYKSKYRQSENTYCRYDVTGKIDLIARILSDGSVNVYRRTIFGFQKVDGYVPKTWNGTQLRIIFTKDYIIYKSMGSSTDTRYTKFSINGNSIKTEPLEAFSSYDGGPWQGVFGCSVNNIILSGGQSNTATYDLDTNKKIAALSRVMSGNGYGIYEVDYPFTNTAGVNDANIIKLRVDFSGFITEDDFVNRSFDSTIGTYLEQFNISICLGVNKYFDWDTKTFRNVEGDTIYAPFFIYSKNMGVSQIESKDSSGNLFSYYFGGMYGIKKMSSISTGSDVYKNYGDIQVTPNEVSGKKELYTSSGTNIYRLSALTSSQFEMSIFDTGSFRNVIDMSDQNANFRRYANDAGYVFESPWHYLYMANDFMQVSNPSDILYINPNKCLMCIGSSLPSKSVMLISASDGSIGTVTLPAELTYEDSFILHKKDESSIYLVAINKLRAVTYEFNVDNNQFTKLSTTSYSEIYSDPEKEYSFKICYIESEQRIIRSSGTGIQVFKVNDSFELERIPSETDALWTLLNNERVLYMKPLFNNLLFIGTTNRGLIISVGKGAYANHPSGSFFSFDGSSYKSFGLNKESEFEYRLCMYNQNGLFEQYKIVESRPPVITVDVPSSNTMNASSLTGIYDSSITDTKHNILVLPYSGLMASTIIIESPNDLAIIKGTIE